MDQEPAPRTAISEPIRRNIVILGIRLFLVLLVSESLFFLLLSLPLLGYVGSDGLNSYTYLLWFIQLVKAPLLTYVILATVLSWVGTVYYISDEHLIRQRGVLNISEHIFQLKDIEAVNLHQSWLGRLLNLGDITITFFVGRERHEVVLFAINNPEKFERMFSKYV